MISRRFLLLILLLTLPIRVTATPPEKGGRPNILLILVDDLGYGDLSSYGATNARTPHMDALVNAGMRFDRFYANAPVCSPTRASLLTGRYPDLVGVPGLIRTRASESWGYLHPDAVLLPTLLGRAGYHTGMVGKWHLGLKPPNLPLQRGFDHFKGFLAGTTEDYYTHRRNGRNYMRSGNEVIAPKGHVTDLFTDWAVQYIRERSSSEAPFFLYLAHNAPHSPIQPPTEWLEKVKKREGPDLPEERAKFVALVEHLDQGIGQVVEALKETGQYENTLILLTSDNGGATYLGASNGGLRGDKMDMYEGGLRVPMAAAWPGHINPGTRSNTVALTMDLFPTIAEAAGARIDHPIDGRSLLPVLQGQRAPWPERTLFFVRREGRPKYHYMGKAARAVRRGDWKLLQNRPMQPFELYNLAEDPKEQRNLAEERLAKFEELAGALRQHIMKAGEVPWQRPESALPR